MTPGTRVQVQIPSAEVHRWHRATARALQGAIGTVEEVGSDVRGKGRALLVRFDAPITIDPDRLGSRPCAAFHFELHEVIEVGADMA